MKPVGNKIINLSQIKPVSKCFKILRNSHIIKSNYLTSRAPKNKHLEKCIRNILIKRKRIKLGEYHKNKFKAKRITRVQKSLNIDKSLSLLGNP